MTFLIVWCENISIINKQFLLLSLLLFATVINRCLVLPWEFSPSLGSSHPPLGVLSLPCVVFVIRWNFYCFDDGDKTLVIKFKLLSVVWSVCIFPSELTYNSPDFSKIKEEFTLVSIFSFNFHSCFALVKIKKKYLLVKINP